MSYKLYDFTDPNKSGFAAELDEQIRLLCDVLYNQREIYPGQLSGRISSNPYIRKVDPLTFPNVMSRGFSLYRDDSVVATDGVGVGSSPSFTLTAHNAEGQFGTLSTTTTATIAWASGVSGTGGRWVPRYQPYLELYLRTGSAINSKVFIGLSLAGNNSAISRLDGSSSPQAVNERPMEWGLYYDASDSNRWKFGSYAEDNGSFYRNIYSTGVEVLANTCYWIKMQLVKVAANTYQTVYTIQRATIAQTTPWARTNEMKEESSSPSFTYWDQEPTGTSFQDPMMQLTSLSGTQTWQFKSLYYELYTPWTQFR